MSSGGGGGGLNGTVHICYLILILYVLRIYVLLIHISSVIKKLKHLLIVEFRSKVAEILNKHLRKLNIKQKYARQRCF